MAPWLVTFGVSSLAVANAAFDRSAVGNLPAASGTMSVHVDRSHAFIASLALGTPPQQLKVLVDSGSADLWVPSKRCQDCGSANHFFADASNTFSPSLRQTPQGPRVKAYSVHYGSGVVAGFGAEETLTIGPWQIKNQSFIIVEDQRIPMSNGWDGIFGLGWNGIAEVGKPAYTRMQEAGHPAIFALVPIRQGEASMSLGKVPMEQLKAGSLVWTDVVDLPLKTPTQSSHKHTFWTISAGVAITQSQPTPEKFLVDTGTNRMLLVPTRFYRNFIQSLLPPNSFEQHCGVDHAMGNLIICDCHIGQDASLPPLRLFLGGRAFQVPIPELFTHVATRDGGSPLCLLEVQPNDMAPDSADSLMGGMLPGLINGMPGVVTGGPGPAAGGFPIPFPAMAPPANSVQGGQPTQSAMPLPPQLIAQMGGIDKMLPAMMKNMPKNVKPGEEVEEVVEQQPDGSVCTTQIIHEPDGKTRRERKCQQGRRLQAGGVIVEPVAVQQAGGAMPILGQPAMMPPPVQQNPMADLWVLGGVFMEKFITVFDFDNGRIGFAEPLNQIVRTSSYEMNPEQTYGPAPAPVEAAMPREAAGQVPTPALRTGGDKASAAGFPWTAFLAVIVAGSTCLVIGLCAPNVPWRTPRSAGNTRSMNDELNDDLPGE